jgi:hypothetical protein
MEKTISDMSTLGVELQADLKKQRRISAFFATMAIAEGILILCFGIGQLFF